MYPFANLILQPEPRNSIFKYLSSRDGESFVQVNHLLYETWMRWGDISSRLSNLMNQKQELERAILNNTPPRPLHAKILPQLLTQFYSNPPIFDRLLTPLLSDMEKKKVFPALLEICKTHFLSAVRQLLHIEGDKWLLPNLFILAATEGYMETVRFLIEERKVNPTVFNNLALASAIENGKTEMIEYLFIQIRDYTHQSISEYTRSVSKLPKRKGVE